ncbi:MAG: Clp protease ClpP, partial [Lentisphaerae bacterium]|nr:Clp protease ClpP [Lentisphaerota bacterium]
MNSKNVTCGRGYAAAHGGRNMKSLELDLYGDVGAVDGIDPAKVVALLRGAPDAKRINIRLNSPGGSAFDGIAIFNALKDHPAKVTVKVDGLAASAASIIAMAGDTIEMGEGSFLMVHRA